LPPGDGATISQTFCAKNLRLVASSPYSGCATHLNEFTTDPVSLLEYELSFSKPERTATIPLEQKLQQLNPKTMSRLIETSMAEAAIKNLNALP
jgi:hypothetical protein